jgi:hypothetical protein
VVHALPFDRPHQEQGRLEPDAFGGAYENWRAGEGLTVDHGVENVI